MAAVAAGLLVTLTVPAAESNSSNAPPSKVLMLDNLGQVVQEPTNQVPASFIPPARVGLKQQIPEPVEGTSQPEEILERSRQAAVGFHWLPPVPPPLAPYLASQNQFGNLAGRPGPLFPVYPLEPLIQGPKYWLSQYGLNYSLKQTVTLVNMSGVMQGESTLAYYTLDLKSAWTVYASPATGTAGWLRTQLDAKSGIGAAGQDEDARRNLGMITDPTGIWSSVNGLRVPELAWGQSLLDGTLVAMAGMVNQGNYFDRNPYAQSGRGQFLNSALIHSRVLPLRRYNFGMNLQWQPLREWYAMVGASAGNNTAGFAPWTDFDLGRWSLLGEVGYAPVDVLGLGPGIYRVQPFLARTSQTEVWTFTSGSDSVSSTNLWQPVQAGLCFDLQQKLGLHSPFGWFGRFGFGGNEVSNGASAEIGTGFLWQGPFRHLLLERTSNDLLGLAFVWSQPSATSKTIYHPNEYVVESFYALQFSPTLRIRPDFQFVINPAFNPEHDLAMVFQLQLELAW